MIGTYASAALICAASLLVGRALLSLAGHRLWSWLEPAVGLGAIFSVTGALARAPGHGSAATLGLCALLAAAAALTFRRRDEDHEAADDDVPAADGTKTSVSPTFSSRRLEWALVAVVVVAVLSIPFAVSGRWGLLGVGLNNDLGLHLAWAEWLRSGFGPALEPGYPMGPHGLAVAVAAVPGIGLGQAFVGQIFAIGILTAWTALGALRDLRVGGRVLAATLVASCYLSASYFAQGAFKEMAEALFVLAVAVGLLDLSRRRADSVHMADPFVPSAGVSGWARVAPVPLAIAGGIFFSYSFVGLAWPVAIVALWGLTLPAVRRALRPRALLRFLLRPATLAAAIALAALAVAVTFVGPFGFIHGFNNVAGARTYGPVSPIEALGVWPAANYRLDAPGGATLPGLAGAIAVLALAAGLVWWVRRREAAVPIAFGACVALYLMSLPVSGDYSRAKALIIAAPLTMLLIVRPLVAEFLHRRRAENVDIDDGIGPSAGLVRAGWAALAVAFIGGAVYSSFLALRDAPVSPPGHGAELRAFLPIVRGEPVLYAGQDRYAAYGLSGADTHVPLVEFPDSAVTQNPEKPFDTGNAYSPIDFDSFSQKTLDGSLYVVTSRAAWTSQAPENFRRVAATPSYVLWERTGPPPAAERHVLLEGTDAGAFAGCASPEIRILLADPGRASLFPAPVIGAKARWDEGAVLQTGERTSQALDLPGGEWNLSLQYFSPFGLTLSAPGFSESLMPALDGQRPNTISLANDGQFWPAGRLAAEGGRVEFTIEAAEASALQSLSGYDGRAYVGSLVAVPVAPRRIVPLREACDSWIDWYESSAAP